MPKRIHPKRSKGKTSDKDIIAFARYFHELDKKIGIERIEQKLRELYDSEAGNEPTLIKNRIMEEITRVYGIPQKALLTSTKRGNATQARVMAIILFYRHLTLSKSEIAEIFGHSQPNIVSLRLKTFAKYFCGEQIFESERRFEKVYSQDFMKKIVEVDKCITEFCKSEKKPLIDWKKW